MRAIDADHLRRWILSRVFKTQLSVADVIDQIDREDTIEPERKKGKWLEMAGDLQCSECGATYYDLYPDYSDTKFCPNCGSYNGGENDQSK